MTAARGQGWRIGVHDYAGHPFQVQLSRELARRGHEVLHLYSASFVTPHGRLAKDVGDPGGFDVAAVSLPTSLNKRAYVRRWLHERAYGRQVIRALTRFRPQALISANTPLESQRSLLRYCRRTGCRFVYWVQDLYGLAAYKILRRRLPLVGGWVGRHYMRLERRLISRSDAVVLISDAFLPVLNSCDGGGRTTVVIPNWAPLEELPARSRDNQWAVRHGLVDKEVLLYAGTLGMKHSPELLLALAVRCRDRPAVRVVVVSEGSGTEWLRSRARSLRLENLLFLAYQPFDQVPDMLASADVLLAILDVDASAFSVPSKVLTYLCAGRPVLAAIPEINQAARVIEESGAGVTVPPADDGSFVREAERLLRDRGMREEMGWRARAYAEREFDISANADRFEAILIGDVN